MSVKVLEAALYSYLTADAMLAALSGQGVWNLFRPEEVAYNFANPLTWVTFAVERGGDTNDASGDRFKDVTALIGGHADGSLTAKATLDIDARLETLLEGWQPTLAGWPAVWKTERTDTINWTAYDGNEVVERFNGANYRFRYGQDA